MPSTANAPEPVRAPGAAGEPALLEVEHLSKQFKVGRGRMLHAVEDVSFSIPGAPPDLFAPPAGCGFGARCPHCMDVCVDHDPDAYGVSPTHGARCWLLDPRAGNAVAPPVGDDTAMVTPAMLAFARERADGAAANAEAARKEVA